MAKQNSFIGGVMQYKLFKGNSPVYTLNDVLANRGIEDVETWKTAS